MINPRLFSDHTTALALAATDKHLVQFLLGKQRGQLSKGTSNFHSTQMISNQVE